MAYGFKYAKNTGRSPGFLSYTDENMKHIGWCIKTGIKIAVIPQWEGASDELSVELKMNKKIH